MAIAAVAFVVTEEQVERLIGSQAELRTQALAIFLHRVGVDREKARYMLCLQAEKHHARKIHVAGRKSRILPAQAVGKVGMHLPEKQAEFLPVGIAGAVNVDGRHDARHHLGIV